MREIRLHDTRSGELRQLEPRDPGRVSIYACGPTVYARVHVGNARPLVVFSLLKRFLQHEGYAVTFVANVTDVNDKIYDAARAAGVPSDRLAREMTAAYVADTDGLGLGRPDHEPLATETIDEIVALIATLIERGHAYAVQGDVYFDVRSYPPYGELSHRAVGDMDQGEDDVDPAGRAGTAPLKRDPLDFALWKAQKDGDDTAWDAPWGRGRPGWHIECSAMAETLLGVGFDIHGGGSDLVFPHHENEAAQTAAARGAPLTQLWVHNGMVRLEGEKMAKSVGNIFLLHEALAAHGRDALVLYFCGGHYRQPIAYSEERLAEAARSVERIRDAGRRLAAGASPAELAPLREAFFGALADDFNTPRALASLFEWVRESNRRGEAGETVGDGDLREMLGVLALDGLLDADADAGGPDAAAQELLARREAARAAREFAEADRLRDELAALGWEVRDSADGPTLVPRA
ncbi:MAG TPA: cysteine--tRNA ligase [Conexibacter sp.]|nr:cysteine--tRNA ligase [Conexibacter sp.]